MCNRVADQSRIAAMHDALIDRTINKITFRTETITDREYRLVAIRANRLSGEVEASRKAARAHS
ncbi:hypothetical protein GCM10029978_029280 [Actinoallomurus acanthiterrae]